MSVLTIQCDTQTCTVKGRDILYLELKLNLTEKSREYSHIGEHLYQFYVKEGCEGQPVDIIEVNKQQYEYLLQLHHTSYQDVWSEYH